MMAGGGGGFDPNAMAMMYQNMMKNTGMGESSWRLLTWQMDHSADNLGGMGMGFDPNAMAMMYQNMMKSESSRTVRPEPQLK